MSRQNVLVILVVLFAVCVAVPYRFSRHLPLIIRRTSQQIDDKDLELVNEINLMLYQDNRIVPVPQWRERRGQPIIDYTDEFSADPFEVLFTQSVCYVFFFLILAIILESVCSLIYPIITRK
uniref:Uncharacterized protein n=1 Tax=Angiostrongylus cantonensis TaxID=6313 RepID=A0A0K0DCJ1_ANGCA